MESHNGSASIPCLLRPLPLPLLRASSQPIRHLTQTCSHSAHTHTSSGDRSSPLLPFHPSGFSNKRARPWRHRMSEIRDSHPDTCFHNAPPPRSLSPSSCTLTPPRVSLSVAVTQVERRPTGCGDPYFLFGVSASVGSSIFKFLFFCQLIYTQ